MKKLGELEIGTDVQNMNKDGFLISQYHMILTVYILVLR